jgi:hypothetical protein
MTITFLPVRFPTEAERVEPALWSRNVREEMGIKLGMQLVPYTFETECIRVRSRDLGLAFNELKCSVRNLRLAIKITASFASMDANRDGWLCEEDADRVGLHFSRAFRACFKDIKQPESRNTNETINSDSWIETGMIGWLSGGRPLLPQRPPDPYRDDALEVTEVITYFDQTPSPEFIIAFNVGEFFTHRHRLSI